MTVDAHSAAWIDDSRVGWWDADFIAGFLKSINGSPPQSILDLGAGGGHWSRALKAACPEIQEAVLVDNDPHWVAKLRQIAKTNLLFPKTEIISADICDLPIQDCQFDLVTCQTVLMHLADPLSALNEMIRVCEPGGIILIAEPINVMNYADIYTAIGLLEPNEIAALVRAWTAYHQGIKKIKGFDYDIALKLPQLLNKVGIDLSLVRMSPNPTMFDAGLDNSNWLDEYTQDKFSFARIAGLSSDEWEEARQAGLKLQTKNRKNIYVQYNLYVFGFLKPAIN